MRLKKIEIFYTFYIFEKKTMKTFFSLSLLFLLLSCKKEAVATPKKKIDSVQIVDSINTVRNKINDSIRNKNQFGRLDGNHQLLHQSISGKGTITFKKVIGNNDEYEINGSLKSGNNIMSVKGFGIRVSEKHFNFTGEIDETINGKPYLRKGTKTFLTKDGGKTWRLQDMVNGDGFVEYIDIKM